MLPMPSFCSAGTMTTTDRLRHYHHLCQEMDPLKMMILDDGDSGAAPRAWVDVAGFDPSVIEDTFDELKYTQLVCCVLEI